MNNRDEHTVIDASFDSQIQLTGNGSLSIQTSTNYSLFTRPTLTGLNTRSLEAADFTGAISVSYDRSGQTSEIATIGQSASVYASARAVGIAANIVDRYSGSTYVFSQAGTAIVTLDTASSTRFLFAGADVRAEASALRGNFDGAFHGTASATALGGFYRLTIIGDGPGMQFTSGPTSAYTIRGGNLNFTDFNGYVSAHARPYQSLDNPLGIERVYVYAISAVEKITLLSSGGHIEARVIAPDNLDLEYVEERSNIYSIHSGAGNDLLRMRDTSLIGSIELGRGINAVSLGGGASLKGDIQATQGRNQIVIEDGAFRPQGRVSFTNLDQGKVDIAAGGFLEFEGTTSGASADHLDVTGRLVLQADTPLKLSFDGAGLLEEAIGAETERVAANGGIEGRFFRAEDSFFDFDIIQDADSVRVRPTAISGLVHPFAALVQVQLAFAEAQTAPFLATAEAEHRFGWQWHPFLHTGETSGNNVAPGYDWHRKGAILDFAHYLNGDTRWSAGFTFSDLDVRGKSTGANNTAETYRLHFTFSHELDAFNVSGGIALSYSKNNVKRRSIATNSYEADFDNIQYSAHLEIDKILNLQRWGSLRPFLAARYNRIDFQDYQEKGAVAPMHISGDRWDSFRGTIGIEHTTPPRKLLKGRIHIESLIATSYQTGIDQISSTAEFGNYSQTVVSPRLSSQSYSLRVGPTWQLNEHLIWQLGYQTNLSDDARSNEFGLSLSGTF